MTRKTSATLSTLALACVLLAVPLSGQFVYVANNGCCPFSNDVSGYTINATTGALTAIPGSPFPAGLFPISVAVDPTGKFAYVANEGSNDVSGYTINATTGALTAIPGSPFPVPAGAAPFSVAVDPTGKFAYVVDLVASSLPGAVSGYTIDAATGSLTAIPGSPFPAGVGPFSVAVDPTGKFAYVANFNNGGSGDVSGYTINATTGALTAIPGSPFPAGLGPLAVTVTRAVTGLNQPPVAKCQNVTVSAGSSCTANASVDNGSFDPDVGDTITLSQSPAGPYGLGATLATLTVTDSHGASNTCSATVTVVDKTPPSIACPANVTVTANLGSQTAVATFPAPTATDNCSVASKACSPSSGSSFLIGATTDTCTATDGAGNRGSCTFTVTVLTPQAATQAVIQSVNNLVSQGILNAGQGDSLVAKLQAAISQMNRGNGTAARNQLLAFISEAGALVNSGRLTLLQGQVLIDAANNLMAHIP